MCRWKMFTVQCDRSGEQEWCLVLLKKKNKPKKPTYEGKCQTILVNQTLEITPAQNSIMASIGCYQVVFVQNLSDEVLCRTSLSATLQLCCDSAVVQFHSCQCSHSRVQSRSRVWFRNDCADEFCQNSALPGPRWQHLLFRKCLEDHCMLDTINGGGAVRVK